MVNFQISRQISFSLRYQDSQDLNGLTRLALDPIQDFSRLEWSETKPTLVDFLLAIKSECR